MIRRKVNEQKEVETSEARELRRLVDEVEWSSHALLLPFLVFLCSSSILPLFVQLLVTKQT